MSCGWKNRPRRIRGDGVLQVWNSEQNHEARDGNQHRIRCIVPDSPWPPRAAQEAHPAPRHQASEHSAVVGGRPVHPEALGPGHVQADGLDGRVRQHARGDPHVHVSRVHLEAPLQPEVGRIQRRGHFLRTAVQGPPVHGHYGRADCSSNQTIANIESEVLVSEGDERAVLQDDEPGRIKEAERERNAEDEHFESSIGEAERHILEERVQRCS